MTSSVHLASDAHPVRALLRWGAPSLRRSDLTEAVLLAVVYAVVGKLGLMADAVSGFATLLWPPSGIALAALLLRGNRLWPGIAMGALLANVWSGAPVATACAIAAGNTLEGLLGAAALRRLGFDSSLERVRDVLMLAGIAACLTTMVSSTVGVASLYLAGVVRPGSAALTWRAWWLGDMASELIVAPLLLTVAAKGASAGTRRIGEAVALVVSIVAVWALIFRGPPFADVAFQRAYLLFPPLIWAALRFDQRAVAAATLLAAASAALGTALGLGPFADGALHESLMGLQVFVMVLAVTALVLGAEVAERTSAARDCRASDERLRLAQQAARLGTFDWSIQSGVIVWTPELEAMHGLPPGAFAGTRRAWEELVHPDDREELARRIEHAFAMGAPIEGEWRVRWPDARVRWLAGRWQVLRDDSGKPVRVIGVNLDITDRKRAEEYQERLAAIVESSDDAIIAKDLDGVILAWNAGAVRLFGYTAEEAIGRSIRMLLPADLQGEEDEVQRRLREDGGIRHLETVRVAKDGRLVEVSTSVSPLHDASGRVVGASTIAHDIADRKRAENALLEADRRKDQFLGVLSHELRNPLAPIRNSIYILERSDPAGEVARRARAVIGRQVEHMTRLVDDLLDVTRIARGKIRLRRASEDLAEIVRGSGEDHRAVLEERGLSLRVAVPPHPIWVDGDATRLSQIIGNLLQNAAKFSPPGTSVALALVADGSWAEIRVRDQGIGIEPGVLHKLFDPFFQAQATLARSEGGLGLGLALVKGLAELHGGTVRAESAGAGEGAEFVVRLPAAAVERVTEPVVRGSGVAPHRRARVLVVEDDREVAGSMVQLLELLGHDVELARDGPTAIASAHSHPPDVLLCDVGLPGMSGYDVARAFRSDPLLRTARLVAVTGYALDEDRVQAAHAGFDCHIAKPADPDEIERLLA